MFKKHVLQPKMMNTNGIKFDIKFNISFFTKYFQLRGLKRLMYLFLSMNILCDIKNQATLIKNIFLFLGLA